MARRRDESGVPNTCPFIDEAIEVLSKCECEDLDPHSAIQALEKVRSYNDDLRTWGNDQRESAEEWEESWRNADKEIDDLRAEIKNLRDEIASLERELSDAV